MVVDTDVIIVPNGRLIARYAASKVVFVRDAGGPEICLCNSICEIVCKKRIVDLVPELCHDHVIGFMSRDKTVACAVGFKDDGSVVLSVCVKARNAPVRSPDIPAWLQEGAETVGKPAQCRVEQPVNAQWRVVCGERAFGPKPIQPTPPPPPTPPFTPMEPDDVFTLPDIATVTKTCARLWPPVTQTQFLIDDAKGHPSPQNDACCFLGTLRSAPASGPTVAVLAVCNANGVPERGVAFPVSHASGPARVKVITDQQWHHRAACALIGERLHVIDLCSDEPRVLYLSPPELQVVSMSTHTTYFDMSTENLSSVSTPHERRRMSVVFIGIRRDQSKSRVRMVVDLNDPGVVAVHENVGSIPIPGTTLPAPTVTRKMDAAATIIDDQLDFMETGWVPVDAVDQCILCVHASGKAWCVFGPRPPGAMGLRRPILDARTHDDDEDRIVYAALLDASSTDGVERFRVAAMFASGRVVVT